MMYDQIKYESHWAENLEVGDKVTTTIRHKTDGSKNIHRAEVIVVENNRPLWKIKAAFQGNVIEIKYNDLNEK